MSFNYGTYVGPYARCKAQQEPVTRYREACLSMLCSNHTREMRVKFCELCGSSVGTVPYTVVEFSIDDYDVSEAIDEALCNPGGDDYMHWSETNAAHLWIPNKWMPGRDPHLEEREAFSLAEITAKQLEGEILQFQVTFEDEIAELRRWYGLYDVTLHWGVIQHYS